jgi:YebC/PmpR family DNA-binding regulatory protein
MSGHNKWAQIKRKKAVTDAKKSKIFTKIVRLIGSEARLAKGDTNAPGLRAAIEKAKEANMPSDNIERAIKKASEPSATLTPITYEAYGPAGVGIIIDTLSENRNKTAQEIKFILSSNGYPLAGIGSVSWAFTKAHAGAPWQPTAFVEVSEQDAEALEQLIDALEENDDVQEVYTNAE